MRHNGESQTEVTKKQSTDSSKCPMEITKLIRKLKSVNLLLFYMTETETKTLNMKRETNNEIITTRF